MSIAPPSFVPNEIRTSILKIYTYQDKNLAGTFYNAYYGREIPFHNLTRLLLLIEDLLNDLDCPQSTINDRSFREQVRSREQTTLLHEAQCWEGRKPLATFRLMIIFRQNACWQGKLSRTDEDQEVSFRSVLELVKLMDTALPQPRTRKQRTPKEQQDHVV